MKVTINDVRDNCRYIDKDSLSHYQAKDIINLQVNNDSNISNIDTFINVIAALNNFTNNELIVYSYIINNHKDCVITINKAVAKHLAKTNCISLSSITRAVAGLVSKDVINNSIVNGKIVLAEYVVNDNFDITKYLIEDATPKVAIIFIT